MLMLPNADCLIEGESSSVAHPPKAVAVAHKPFNAAEALLPPGPGSPAPKGLPYCPAARLNDEPAEQPPALGVPLGHGHKLPPCHRQDPPVFYRISLGFGASIWRQRRGPGPKAPD